MPARTDLVRDVDVIRDLANVRLGTSMFRRALNQLSDDDLDEPSLLPGWTRRHVVAHVGYNARAIARLVEWAATGEPNPMYSSPGARAEEIDFGATLNPEALRNLVEHSAIDLDVRWRDLPADRWSFQVVTAQGRDVPVSETVWMRTREVWLHAVDLAGGAQVSDIPTDVLTRLLDDIHGTWRTRDEQALPALRATDESLPKQWAGGESGVVVEGPVAALAAWATGRMAPQRRDIDLAWPGGVPIEAPRWI
ncbi:maleylpyruvate isomerase family mycothiol-dependent enzyme [Nocardioides sp. YR527]|uniref:maleylpyruvate isomerase family mycothiol-dependent enzyme n=1 Tax=Nocardioides sp. YR527 TaxID=1881028 RepID=UPI00210ADB78|nr:maleylpyruvate isomerase family mycothiol-dependent enzyme [Nocardioides sp. YR527]